jgi:uncharacterized protein (TIGR02266 family)
MNPSTAEKLAAPDPDPQAETLATQVVRQRISTCFDLLDAHRDQAAWAAALADRLEPVAGLLDSDLGAVIAELRPALADLQRAATERDAEAPALWVERATVAAAMALSAAVALQAVRDKLPASAPRRLELVNDEAEERRAAQRVAVDVEVDLASEHQFFVGYSEDLSDGGLFVATYVTHPVGTELELRIELADFGSLEMMGRVVWMRERSDHSPPGMGIVFEQIGPEQNEAIMHFLRSRPPLFYDV